VFVHFVMIISIYPHFLLYTNVNITLSNIAILFSISLLSIFLVCFMFTLFVNVLETFRLMPWTLHTNIVDLY
jgi:hypothetical protein